jgi:cellulose biosynthesis protein BcsQ
MCARIVTVLNRKGGVGKTTLTIAIADTLISEHQANVTIVDLDPQATASQVLLPGIVFKARTENYENLTGLLTALLKPQAGPDWHRFRIDGLAKILGQPRDRLRLYPNSDAFWDFEGNEIAKDNEKGLREAVNKFLMQEKQDRHYILIDCPPGQSITAKAFLNASDLVICPMNPDWYSVWGKDLLKRYLHRVAPQTHYKFVINRFNRGLSVHNNVVNELRSNGHDADMLNVMEGGRFGRAQDRALFNVNVRVMKRLEMTQQKPLYRIYGNDGAQQLKKIVDATLKELKRDG